MNGRAANTTSMTDPTRVDAMADEDIDYSDIPPITAEQFAKAKLAMPSGPAVPVEMKVSGDPLVAAWCVAQGLDRDRWVAVALRIYAQAHAG